MEEVYRLERVSCFYGEVAALKDIDLNVLRGESISVLGANGAGKSTLLKLLDGLIFPSSGRVMFFGMSLGDAVNLKALRERVGFVFSEPDVQLFSPTVFDEVAFGPLQIGLSGKEVVKRVEDTLTFLGLSHLKERPPYTLSTGEKKKVAIGSVLSINPEVLLLDEPTTGLDPKTQVWLIEVLAELKKIGKTCIIATHDLSLAADLSDRVVILGESHTIASVGSAEHILGNKELLLGANLIHEHAHRHGEIIHRHSHGPFSIHDEHE
ncbi:MAG: ABC transporter ATP-binding protein [Deltaproteobacteria bacterium]|nr:ABC transporter ATP-binding protein [Deltaproteobacteria bacterium]